MTSVLTLAGRTSRHAVMMACMIPLTGYGSCAWTGRAAQRGGRRRSSRLPTLHRKPALDYGASSRGNRSEYDVRDHTSRSGLVAFTSICRVRRSGSGFEE